MSIEKIYDALLCLVNDLLIEPMEAMGKIAEYMGYFSDLFSIVIQDAPQRIGIYEDAVKEFVTALENKDIFEMSDILYGAICKNIEMDFEQNIKFSQADILTSKEIIEDYRNYNIEQLKNSDNVCRDVLVGFLTSYEDNNNVVIDTCGNIAVLKNDRYWRLNSFCNPLYAAEGFINKFHINNMYICIVVGMANMSYIDCLLKKVSPDVQIVIYEPDKEVFATNCCYKNMNKVFSNSNVKMFVKGINDAYFIDYLYFICDSAVLANNICYIETPSYLSAYKKECDEIQQEIKKITQKSFTIDKTMNATCQAFNYNRIMNLPLIFSSKKLSELKKYLQENVDFEKIPAVIVAAGPSLDKNVELLKKIKGKAFIIAVDTSIKMLSLYGIIPDAFITLDAVKPMEVFDSKVGRDVPVFYTDYSVHDALQKNTAAKIYYNILGQTDNLNIYEDVIAGEGGSVSNVAFRCVRYLGFKTIIFIGLDLAFSGGKKHTKIAYKESDISEAEKFKYTYVEGIDGRELLTYKNFKYYIDAFETEIEKSKGQLKFINATEGGANIKGAINMSFEETISKYCNSYFDFSEIIKTVSSESVNITSINSLINDLIDQCKDRIHIYHEQKLIYKQLIGCCDKDKIEQLLNQIKTINNGMEKKENYFISGIIASYVQEEKCSLLKKMYDARYEGQNKYEEKDYMAYTWLEILDVYDIKIKRIIALFERCMDEM